MVRRFVHLALLFALLAVHGAGLARFVNGAILCIDEAGVAVEGAADAGHCPCDGEDEFEPTPVELIAPDCVDIALSLDAQLQYTSVDTAVNKLIAPALLPAALQVLAHQTEDSALGATARVRRIALPPPNAPTLAAIRTVILRT